MSCESGVFARSIDQVQPALSIQAVLVRNILLLVNIPTAKGPFHFQIYLVNPFPNDKF